MLGPIKQIIGPARARLQEFLKKLPRLHRESANEEECRKIVDEIESEQICISNSVNLLLQRNAEWWKFIASLNDEEKKEEIAIYEVWTDDKNPDVS